MKPTIVLILASMAALTFAQVKVNPDGTYVCALPNAAYCAGVTLDTNIMIRCTDSIGHLENCNDKLTDYPPLDTNWTPCWQSSPTAGDAACSKNDVVYPSSGGDENNSTTPFPVPGSDVSSGAGSTFSASLTTTLTSTSTRTHVHTLYTTVSTSTVMPTITTISSASVTDGPVGTDVYTIYSSTTVSAGTSTVHVTLPATISTTISVESATLSVSSTSVALSDTVVAATTSLPFAIPLNSTTLNVGPGPASVSSWGIASVVPYGTAPTGSYSSLTSAGIASSAVNSTTVTSASASVTSPAFTGSAVKSGKAGFAAMAALGLLVGALI